MFGTTDQIDFLGTKNWQSLAHFNAGVRCQENGDYEAAALFYEKALSNDPNNKGALVNLQIVKVQSYLDDYNKGLETRLNDFETRKIFDQDYEEDRQQLIRRSQKDDWPSFKEVLMKSQAVLLHSLKTEVNHDAFIKSLRVYRFEPVLYTAKYQLVVTFALEAEYLTYSEEERLREDQDKQIALKEAEKYASDLADEIDKQIKTLQKPHFWPIFNQKKRASRDLTIQYLTSVRPIVYLNLAEIAVRQRNFNQAANCFKEIEYSQISERGAYDLAAYYSVYGNYYYEQHNENPELSKNEAEMNYDEAESYLIYAIKEQGSKALKRAQLDPLFRGLRLHLGLERFNALAVFAPDRSQAKRKETILAQLLENAGKEDEQSDESEATS